jgi:LuxR family maltose regulon positive regulatory protein
MFELLQAALYRGIHPDYIHKLLPEFKLPAATQVAAAVVQPEARLLSQAAGLVDPLSERELQVLRLLNSALSNDEIARELYVSVNTVRTHLQNIYTKLGVNRRRDAISRAKQLKLI